MAYIRKRGNRWPVEVDRRGVKAHATFATKTAAQVWARKWLEITKDKPGAATDEGAMIGWFATAIMAGYDSAMLRSNAR